MALSQNNHSLLARNYHEANLAEAWRCYNVETLPCWLLASGVLIRKHSIPNMFTSPAKLLHCNEQQFLNV